MRAASMGMMAITLSAMLSEGRPYIGSPIDTRGPIPTRRASQAKLRKLARQQHCGHKKALRLRG